MSRLTESASTALLESARGFYQQFEPVKTGIESVCASMETASKSLATTPQTLVETCARQTKDLGDSLSQNWQRTLEELIRNLERHHFEVLHNIRGEAERTATAMGESAQKIRNVAENVELTLSRGMSEVANTAVKQIELPLGQLRDGLIGVVLAARSMYSR